MLCLCLRPCWAAARHSRPDFVLRPRSGRAERPLRFYRPLRIFALEAPTLGPGYLPEPAIKHKLPTRCDLRGQNIPSETGSCPNDVGTALVSYLQSQPCAAYDKISFPKLDRRVHSPHRITVPRVPWQLWPSSSRPACLSPHMALSGVVPIGIDNSAVKRPVILPRLLALPWLTEVRRRGRGHALVCTTSEGMALR